jgi:hypothetical protein
LHNLVSNFCFKRIETSSVEFVARCGGSVCTRGSLGKSTGTLGSKSTGTLGKGMLRKYPPSRVPTGRSPIVREVTVRESLKISSVCKFWMGTKIECDVRTNMVCRK